ncbi:MAG: amidohydrolase, partial [Alphaproteobacteria bacterium]|nr:amidohydrolase [Alphaproteobacteria bacterium]
RADSMTIEKDADLVLTGGKVITLDPGSRIAEAVAVADGRILAVGADREIESLAGDARRIDLKGRAVVPGLIDGHAHMDREGLKNRLPSLAGAKSIEDILETVDAAVRRAAPGDWVVTMPVGEPPQYWDVPECLAEKRWPNRHDLDRVSPDNPVYIRAIWGHWRNTLPLVSVANTAALKAAGITRDTVPPIETITIEKDADGEPTGVLIEQNYKPIVEHTLMAVAPRFDLDDRADGLRQSLHAYNSFGTTSVFEGHGVNAEVFAAYRTLREQGPLSVRSHLVFSPSWRGMSGEDVEEMLRSWAGWLAGRGLGDDYLRVGGLFTEPAKDAENRLRAQTAPYAGWAGFNFDCELPPDVMVEMMIEAARNNIRIAAIGMDTLPYFEEVNRVAPISDQRWVIVHIGVIDGDQMRRIKDLGLVLTAYTGRYVYDDGEKLRAELGDGRMDEIAPLRSLMDAGIHVSLATDNVPPTLFEAVWHAVARRTRDGGDRLAPEQALSREDALACASREGAWLTFEENDKGTIEAGKFADLAVLSADPLTVGEDDLRDITAELTITGGQVVFDREKDGAWPPGGSGPAA